MSGKPRNGLDYAGWSVNIFDGDTKIDKLLDSQGWIGFSIYFYLCQMAYKFDGYFYRWTYDDAATTARRMSGGVGSQAVINTVGLCLQIGLFDKPLFDRDGILTSRGIQRRFYAAIRDRRRKIVIADYWLLNDEESEGLVKCAANDNLPPANGHLPPANDDLPPANAPKSKVKESKVNMSQHDVATSQKPVSNKKTYEPDSDAYKAARYLDRCICKRLPTKQPANEDTLQRWADDIDKLNRLDKQNWDDIADVLEFSQKDPFWQNNILSGATFRKQNIRLFAKMGGNST